MGDFFIFNLTPFSMLDLTRVLYDWSSVGRNGFVCQSRNHSTDCVSHRDLRMTMRHTHLSPDHLKEAVTTLDSSLKPISNGHSVGTGQSQGVSHDG